MVGKNYLFTMLFATSKTKLILTNFSIPVEYNQQRSQYRSSSRTSAPSLPAPGQPTICSTIRRYRRHHEESQEDIRRHFRGHVMTTTSVQHVKKLLSLLPELGSAFNISFQRLFKSSLYFAIDCSRLTKIPTISQLTGVQACYIYSYEVQWRWIYRQTIHNTLCGSFIAVSIL